MNALSEKELTRNFSEITPPLGFREALLEAERCLYCTDAPCMQACPTHIDVPSFIRKIQTDNLLGSARVILEANPVAASCARVCPVDELCEGACVLGNQETPIRIGQLQRYVMDTYASNKKAREEPLLAISSANRSAKVAVVGAGPAGLSTARELAREGCTVTLFEQRSLGGGLDTYGIVDYRLPKEVSLWEVKEVLRYGVTLRCGITIGEQVSAEELLRDFDAIVLATGLDHVPALNIPGENLPGVYDALEWIEQTKIKRLSEVPVGRKVVVIGGGNTAVDAATAARRLGADEVYVLYRRAEVYMPAYGYEYTFAKQEGVHYLFEILPQQIEGEDHVERLICIRTQPGPLDASGRPRPEPIPDSTFVLSCDMVIRAIGQKRETALLDAFGVAHRNGRPVVHPDTLQSSNPKIFVAGDLTATSEKTTVVASAQQGKQAAASILHMLDAQTEVSIP